MKIKDLKKVSTRLYNAVILPVSLNLNRGVFCNDSKRYIDGVEIGELTVNDLFEMFSEKEIKSWRGMGKTSYERLLSLRD